MNLDNIVYTISFILGERKPDLVVTPGEYGRLLDVAQKKLFKKKLGLPEEYRPGLPLPAQVYEISKVIKDDLRPFLVLKGGDNPALSVDENGEAVLPDDFYFPSTISYKYVKDDGTWDWKEVEILTDTAFEKRRASFIKRPSLKYPCANIYGDKIRFAPTTLKFVELLYLRVPPAPVYAVTYTRGFQEYDSTNSTELLWNDVACIDIINILLMDLGVNISNSDIINYSTTKQTTGT